MRRKAGVVVVVICAVVSGAIYRLGFYQPHYEATDTTIAQFCADRGKIMFKDAPPFQGDAPHPVVIADGIQRHYVGDGERSEVPSDTQAEGTSMPWNPAAKDAQLVGCVDKEVRQPAQQLCNQSTASTLVQVDHYTSIEYAITLYELRTGRRISRATVAPPPGGDCPGPDAPGYVYLEQPMAYLFPGQQQYRKAIGQYVEK